MGGLKFLKKFRPAQTLADFLFFDKKLVENGSDYNEF